MTTSVVVVAGEWLAPARGKCLHDLHIFVPGRPLFSRFELGSFYYTQDADNPSVGSRLVCDCGVLSYISNFMY